MPKGIGARGIGGRAGLALRPIGNRYLKPAPRFLGFGVYISNTPSTVRPGLSGVLHIYAVGGGAGGASGGVQGGGGGSAGYKAVRVGPSSTITITNGSAAAAATDGADTTITVDGLTLIAGAGKTAGTGGVTLGPWDIARPGGAGGGNSAAGQSPTNGGTGGAAGGTSGGGGGPGGFLDQNLPSSSTGTQNPLGELSGTGGAGSSGGTGGAGSNLGAGGGAGTTGGAGSAGGTYMFIIQDS